MVPRIRRRPPMPAAAATATGATDTESESGAARLGGGRDHAKLLARDGPPRQLACQIVPLRANRDGAAIVD
jgi:hypothetical protein